MSYVYIVDHPHDEPIYKYKSVGSRVRTCWNVLSKHKRKFINRRGHYLENGNPECASIYFWGEYEAGSDATLTAWKRPQAIHNYLLPGRGNQPMLTHAHNTDPYVFGDHFKHICCGMRNKKYNPGDMILFGKLDRNKFTLALDTVFIVKEMVEIDNKRDTTQYYKVGIEPLQNTKKCFYRGISFFDNSNYYCFVPCLLPNDQSSLPLPQIDLKALGFTSTARILFTNGIWNQVVKEVTKNGWHIGVHIDHI